MIKLNQNAVDQAMEVTGARSVDHLAQTFLDVTGMTLRNYLSGKTAPSILFLVKMRKLTGIPLDQLVTADTTSAAA